MKKILLVDDNDIHLLLAENILNTKYECITAKSGKEALNYLSKGSVPDLVLLDILMPEMSGWETYNKIRGISLLRDVPIAFLTSVGGFLEKMEADKIGAADYIEKPYKGDELLKRVETIIEKQERKLWEFKYIGA